jgi:hypothetical protein
MLRKDDGFNCLFVTWTLFPSLFVTSFSQNLIPDCTFMSSKYFTALTVIESTAVSNVSAHNQVKL